MDIASLAQPQGGQPQPIPQSTPQGQAALASVMQNAAPSRPTPNRAQTIAGLHRCTEIEKATSHLLKDPDVGKKNIRPKVLEMGADPIGSKVVSMPEFMSGIANFPSSEDALGQKKWVEKLRDSNIQAQLSLLQDHANAPVEANPAQWTPDNHAEHMGAVTNMYKG